MSRYEWSVGGGRPGWRDLLVAALPACAQLASGPGGGSGMLVAVSTGLACGALVPRRVTPVLAPAGTLAAVLLGAGAGAVGAPIAVLIALHALAVNRTAGFALAGSAMATLVAAGTAAVLGEPPRTVAGVALVAAGGAAIAWATGRSLRRGRADRAALRAYSVGTVAVPRFAALAERDRLAAELHDVAAHPSCSADHCPRPRPERRAAYGFAEVASADTVGSPGKYTAVKVEFTR